MSATNTTAMTGVPALEARDYSFAYGVGADAGNPVVSDVSFALPTGAFAVLVGETGMGKSTLLKAFKPMLQPAGRATGSVLVFGRDAGGLDPVQSATDVGFVMQDPESQLVTDTVWHELAFGLENIGIEQGVMRRRVAETAHFFGIGQWFERRVSDLSGGQKQLLNLAAVMAMQPRVLLLDEPTAQLDPISARTFLDALARVNEELGTTVLLVDHRLEDVLSLSSRVLMLAEGGHLAFDGSAQEFASRSELGALSHALPASARIVRALGVCEGESCPLTVREGRAFLAASVEKTGSQQSIEEPFCKENQQAKSASATSSSKESSSETSQRMVEARDVWFRYGAEEPFVLRGVDFSVFGGRVAAIVGGNGSGKSTLLGALAGVRKPVRGKIKVASGIRVALLSQDPRALFVRDTLLNDLMECADRYGYGEAEARALLERFGLVHLTDRHPYDLSGGETQKAALAKVLLANPDVLLLDEPVKGLDAGAKEEIGGIIRSLASQGKAAVFTTHDLEFVASVADECSMLFGCEVTCTQDSRRFFTDNLFYSTPVARMSRGILDGCILVEDVVERLGHDARC